TAKVYIDLQDYKPFVSLGGYLGYGLSGKIKLQETVGGETTTETESIEWGNDENEALLKPFDFGLMVGAGVELNSIVVNIFYQLGLANIATYTDDDSKIKNRVLGVSLGYKLGAN
ncbi:MAG: outer membrane beta-barrel protein, partial [Chitinophagales bacterium]